MTHGELTRRSTTAASDEPDAARSFSSARATWRIDVSEAVPLAGRFELAVDLVVPLDRPANTPRVVLVCLPGGFLSRTYYDLGRDLGHDFKKHADRSYSFAQAMASRGFVTLAFDHLGVGDSSKPEPIEAGYSLGVEVIARVNQLALEQALERLEVGDPSQGIPATPCVATIGVGHSMGSALTVEQQAAARPHRALVLFSFTTHGIPLFLNDDQRSYANDPVRTRRELGEIARSTFGSPYPERADNSESDRRAAFGVGTAPVAAEELLHCASTNLLGLAGLLSMIPGGYAPAAAKIDVPVYILVGDHDLHGERGLREELPNAPSVTTRRLEDCWHCHFVANTRGAIWHEVSGWIHDVLNHGPDSRSSRDRSGERS